MMLGLNRAKILDELRDPVALIDKSCSEKFR